MAVFKFRAVFDGDIDCIRDIEIKSGQTFEDLHNALLSAINFQSGELASFYETDDNWRKGREISLEDMSDEDDSRPDDEKPLIMRKCKLQDFIDDPHAKFIWVYDFLKMWTFALELIKITPKEEPVIIYPRLVKSEGDAPKQFINNNSSVVDEDDEDDTPKRKRSALTDMGGVETYGGDDEFGEDEELDGEGESEDGFDEFSGGSGGYDDDNY
jgi:hypothetical protein